jgi:hypothetical protein
MKRAQSADGREAMNGRSGSMHDYDVMNPGSIGNSAAKNGGMHGKI